MKNILAIITMTLLTASVGANEIHQGPYAGIIGGTTFLNYGTESVNRDMSTGYAIGVCSGYKLPNGFSMEGEVALRRNSVKKVRNAEGALDVKGRTRTTTVMANGIWDLNFCSTDWSPYAGIGVGYARVDNRDTEIGVTTKEQHDRFAWQAIAGINMPITYDADLGIEYRYLDTGPRIDNHSVMLCIKTFF